MKLIALSLIVFFRENAKKNNVFNSSDLAKGQ